MKNNRKKLRVGVVFGGRSTEHEVSLVSASSVMKSLDRKKYDVVPIGITPDGQWIFGEHAMSVLKAGKGRAEEGIVVPDPTRRGLVRLKDGGLALKSEELDVLFPLVHGTFGEDGTMQGLFELAGIPYVGAGVLGSAVGMDKIVSKILCLQAGIPVAPWVGFLASEYKTGKKSILAEIGRRLKYPLFVKPANLGSSVGISKARGTKELLAAIELALRYDLKILVETGIEQAQEIELSVLGNDEPVASIPGEIVSSNEFYDYDAKYVDGKSTAIIPAKLPKPVIRRLQEYAVRAFKVLQCSGMARVDFLVRRTDKSITLNEINTIPGFTSISMYPKLWEASGISYPHLLDRLISLALERFHQRQSLQTRYTPKSDWYRR